jgi:hypothetical protein
LEIGITLNRVFILGFFVGFLFIMFMFCLVSLRVLLKMGERKRERTITQHYPFILSWIKSGNDKMFRGWFFMIGVVSFLTVD